MENFENTRKCFYAEATNELLTMHWPKQATWSHFSLRGWKVRSCMYLESEKNQKCR